MTPGLRDDGQRLLPHVVDRGPDLLQEIEVPARELGGLPQLAEAVEVRLALGRILGWHVQVEGHGGDRRFDRLPQDVGVGLGERPGVVGQDLHLGEARLLRSLAPEAADAIRQVLAAVEHLGQLGVPGLHRGPGRHR